MGAALAVSVASCGGSSVDDSSPTTDAVTSTVGDLTDGSGMPDGDQSEGDLSDMTVRIGVVSTQGGASSRLALQAAGVFDDAPYRVEWVDFDGANAAVEAILAGAVDVLAPILSPAIMLAEGNSAEPWTEESRPVRVVSAWEQVNDTGFQLVVGPDSGFATVEDLDGARVAFSRGTTSHLLVLTLVEEFGVEFDEVILPAAEGRAAFLSGAVDAVAGGYRSLAPLRDSGEAVVIARSLDYLRTLSLVLVRNSFFEDERAEAVIDDVNERLELTEQWSTDNIEVIAEIYVVEGGLNPGQAVEISASQLLERRPFDAETLAILQNEAELLVRGDVVEREPNIAVLLAS